MRRRPALLLVLALCLAGATIWWLLPGEAVVTREGPGELAPAPPLAPPRRSAAEPGPAAVIPGRPEMSPEVPDAGEAQTLLVIRVPGAEPGERAQALQRTANGSHSQACMLVNETCTLTPREGTWLLSVLQRGATPTEHPFEVVAGRNEVTLSRLKTSTVVVRVVDSAGAPVARAALIPAREIDSAEHRLFERASEALTDARGEYPLRLVLGHSESILARADGSFDSERVTVRSTDASVVLTLIPLPSFRGRVVRSDRQIVSRFSIDGQEFETSDGRFTVRITDTLRTRNSQQHVTFRGPGLLPALRVVSAAAGDVDLGDVVLESARVIRGRVLDALTGQPLAGAKVLGESDASTTCDGLGQFTLEAQPVQAVQVVGHARGHAAASVDVGPDQSEVVIRLGSGLSVSGVYKGGSRMTRYVLAVGPTVELSPLDDSQRFAFDSLSPGSWTFVATIHRLDSSVLEGLPVARQSEFVQAVIGMERRGTRLELRQSPITDLELR